MEIANVAEEVPWVHAQQTLECTSEVRLIAIPCSQGERRLPSLGLSGQGTHGVLDSDHPLELLGCKSNVLN